MHRFRSSARTGQALSEYGLVLSIIGVLAIGALVMLGASLSGALQLTANQMVNEGAGAQTAGTSAASDAGRTLDTQRAALGLPEQVRLRDGTVIDPVEYLVDVKETLATVGSNGTTDLLAAKLEALARRLQESDDLTPEQASHLMAMANTGHRVARIEALIEQTARDCGQSTRCYNQTPITFEGRQYANAFELSQLIGQVPVEGQSGQYRQSESNERLHALFQAASQSGAFQGRPEARKLVAALMGRINWLADGVETNNRFLRDGRVKPADFHQHLAVVMENFVHAGPSAGIVKDTPSLETHGHSVTICTTDARHSDSGRHCR